MARARVLIVGCGALGSVLAERLARSGVGHLRIVDRDWVELSNLQRQTLFTEQDASEAKPKAIAAAEHLERINSECEYEPRIEDVNCDTIAELASGCDLVIDGTDNFETRFLINDFALSSGVPWVHGGCLGASGQVMTILPGTTACFRCLLPDLPPREALESCDTAGVLGPTVGLVANWQCVEALKILTGNLEQIRSRLYVFDCWAGDMRTMTMKPARDCKACVQRDFEFLRGEIRTEGAILCGKNAVQLILPSGSGELDGLASRLGSFGEVAYNRFYVRLELPKHRLTIFNGGRTVIEGTTSIAEAKAICSRVLGG